MYEPAAGHEMLYAPWTGAAHGPAFGDGPDVRWLTTPGTWEGVTAGVGAIQALVADGDDLLAFGQGAARLRWDGGRWHVTETTELPASLGAVVGIATGPRGILVVSASSVAWSPDGRRFVLAERRPGDAASFAAGRDTLGPVLATREGFVAFVSDTPQPYGGPYQAPIPWFSPDGLTWERAATVSPFGTDAYVSAIAGPRDGRYVATGTIGGTVGGMFGTLATWVSDDGLAWELLPALPAGSCADPCHRRPGRVVASSAGWIIASWDDGAWTSTDARSWELLEGWPAKGAYMPPVVVVSPGTIVAIPTVEGPGAIAIGTIEP